MTRKQALTDLLAKVEAGNFLAVDLSNVLIINIHHAVGLKNGSLDAAKALFDAVLGDGLWSWQIWTDHNGIPVAVIDGMYFSTPEVTSDNPARAWLAAIIKALIAEETQ